MGRIVIAILVLVLGTPAHAAVLSRYCDLHPKPDGRTVVVVTGTLVAVQRARGITNMDVLDAEILREALADDELGSLRAVEQADAEELARLVADASLRDDARHKHLAVSDAEIDAALASLEHASGNPPGELKARLAHDPGLYKLLRGKVAVALLDAKLHGRPFTFAYRISPPPPCSLLP